MGGAQLHSFLLIFLFFGGAGGAQRSFLALHSGLIPGGLGGPYVVLVIKPGSGMCKAISLPTVLYFHLPRHPPTSIGNSEQNREKVS